MNTAGHLTRRDALKVLGAGAALVGLGTLSKEGFGAEATASAAETKQPFTLPKLGYGYDALEPHIDARTMEIHHTKHHQAYIDNANKALADYPDLQKLSGEQLLKNLGSVPEKIRSAVRNNVGGHLNHTFFWQTLTPGGGGEPNGDLAAALVKDFGSFASFKTAFADAGMKRFGSGWAWLTLTRDGALTVTSSANQDSPLIEGVKPVLGLDVWEHAYYLKYQNRRGDYITAFWNAVNWPQVSANFARARTV